MSRVACHTFFQKLRITTVTQHLLVVISLYYEVVGRTYIPLHLFGNVSYVGHQTKTHSFRINAVTYIVVTIVRHFECRNGEVSKLECSTLLHYVPVYGHNLLVYTLVKVYTFVYHLCGIYRQMVLLTEGSNRLHMVCMVVCNKNMFYTAHIKTIVLEILLQLS